MLYGRELKMINSLEHNAEAKDILKSINKMEKQKKFDPMELIDLCSDLIKLEPEYADIYVKRGKYYFDGCKYPLAIKDFNTAIDMGLQSAEAYYMRSCCYGLLGRNEDKRIADLKAALKFDPRHPQANAEMGHYYFATDYRPMAYKCYTEAIDNKSSDPLVFLQRGIINMDNGRYEYAIVDFLDSQKCNPSNILCYYLRGNCYYEIGALDRALHDYELANFVDRHAPDPIYKMGCVYYDKGDFENCVKQFSLLINLLPDSETGYFSRGVAYMSMNAFKQAIEDFERALAIKGEDGDTCYLLSQAHLALHDEEAGKQYYARAIAAGYIPTEA